jgi:hypothetical protein
MLNVKLNNGDQISSASPKLQGERRELQLPPIGVEKKIMGVNERWW